MWECVRVRTKHRTGQTRGHGESNAACVLTKRTLVRLQLAPERSNPKIGPTQRPPLPITRRRDSLASNSQLLLLPPAGLLKFWSWCACVCEWKQLLVRRADGISATVRLKPCQQARRHLPRWAWQAAPSLRLLLIQLNFHQADYYLLGPLLHRFAFVMIRF